MIEDSANEEMKKFNGVIMDYAKEHNSVLKRFGRFPARNKALGRESTKKEEEFISSHDGWG